MFFRDVLHLRKIEAAGINVISWHSQGLWDKRKLDVVDEETAIRLSKLLRDNRHTFLFVLENIAAGGYFTFLSTYLELHFADFDVEFENLQVVDHITKYDSEIRTKRETKYSIEQKARRCRIAFSFLMDYFKIPNRNTYVIKSPDIKSKVETALNLLSQSSDIEKKLDDEVRAILLLPTQEEIDVKFREIVSRLPSRENEPTNFSLARNEINQTMEIVANLLSSLWNDDRYIRATQNF
jgi:hypothetical protein